MTKGPGGGGRGRFWSMDGCLITTSDLVVSQNHGGTRTNDNVGSITTGIQQEPWFYLPQGTTGSRQNSRKIAKKKEAKSRMISPLQLSGDANLKMVTKEGGGQQTKSPRKPLSHLGD